MSIRLDDPASDLGFGAFASSFDLAGQLRFSLLLLLAPVLFMVAVVPVRPTF